MKYLAIAASLVIAHAFVPAAFAQGQVGTVKPAPSGQAPSPEDKAAGKAKRQAEGAAAAKEQPPGRVGEVPTPPPPSTMGAQEKAAARAERKAEAASAAQAARSASMPKTGEVGPTK